MRKLLIGLVMMAAMALAGSVSFAPSAAKASVLVGQCVENDACWDGPFVPWSDTLTLVDLTGLGLGSTQPFTAAQTACCIIRLGTTTIVFSTAGGPVTESLGEFNGGFHNDPCNYCEVDTVGSFLIPLDATGATISGVFGNSQSDSTAGVDLYLGPAPPFPGGVPEPSIWAVMILGFGAIGSALRRRRPLAATA